MRGAANTCVWRTRRSDHNGSKTVRFSKAAETLRTQRADLSAAEDMQGLIARADAALYQAKQAGRNRVRAGE
jgi:GGDEF domain-containing protein